MTRRFAICSVPALLLALATPGFASASQEQAEPQTEPATAEARKAPTATPTPEPEPAPATSPDPAAPPVNTVEDIFGAPRSALPAHEADHAVAAAPVVWRPAARCQIAAAR